ncbi:conserved hypothetical protein [Ricinus communis]|uniref:CCHC-type domain-containing protein n=1 Tax=Ricinus communis TaxID=3988 RepID=B9SLI2_RICCO|nr:conserved hypothetical protein [Ricinus communis]|eukprot:XP_025014484.1 uncharacterized protein LOC112536130 [Ricinus communis]
MKARSKEAIKAIGARIGTVLDIDDTSMEGLERSVRLRIRIDLRKPLRKRTKIAMGSNKDMWVFFRYERLPSFCYVCGCLGHVMRDCDSRTEDDGYDAMDEKLLPFGDWMRASPFKRTKVIIQDESKSYKTRKCLYNNPKVVEIASEKNETIVEGKEDAVVQVESPTVGELVTKIGGVTVVEPNSSMQSQKPLNNGQSNSVQLHVNIQRDQHLANNDISLTEPTYPKHQPIHVLKNTNFGIPSQEPNPVRSTIDLSRPNHDLSQKNIENKKKARTVTIIHRDTLSKHSDVAPAMIACGSKRKSAEEKELSKEGKFKKAREAELAVVFQSSFSTAGD